MEKTLITESGASQSRSLTRVIFSIDLEAGKLVSVVPCVNSDVEMQQIDPWIQAVLILSDVIRPAAKYEDRRAAAA